MKKMSEIVEITNGYAFKSKEYVSAGIRIIRITNVQKGKIEDSDPKYYPKESLSEFSQFVINEKDILMSLTGNVGRVGLFPKELCPAFLNQRVARLRVTSDEVDMKYLFHYLNSNLFEQKAKHNSSGIAQLNLSTKWVAQTKIPLPPLAEQKKIAALLDAADAYRQQTRALITKYDELAQSLFLDMFGDPVTNPMGWEVKELGEFLEIITYGLTVRPKYHEEGIPLISAREIRTGQINFENSPRISTEDFQSLSKKGKPRYGDILFSKTGSIGHCAIVDSDIAFAITQNAARIKFIESINPVYALSFLRSHYFQQESKRNARGNAVKDLQLGVMKKFNFSNPPFSLQNQFAERIQTIEAQKAQAEESLAQAEDLFGALLQEAFRQ